MGQAQTQQNEESGDAPQNTFNVHGFLQYPLDAEKPERILPDDGFERMFALWRIPGHDHGHFDDVSPGRPRLGLLGFPKKKAPPPAGGGRRGPVAAR